MKNLKSKIGVWHRSILHKQLLFIAFLLHLGVLSSHAQPTPWDRIKEQPQTLDLQKGHQKFSTSSFELHLARSSQTVSALKPVMDEDFDYTPSEWLEIRSRDNFYHLGDINLRVRIGDNPNWIDYSSARQRGNVDPISPSKSSVWAAADLSNTFPDDFPLEIHRYWEHDQGNVVLRFRLQNKTSLPVEIGSLGIPMVFNNMLHNKSLDEAHASCVFYDPYIGQDAGYLQVIRLHGHGPVLLVVPHENASFEAYNPLLDDPTPKGVTFEGFHEWMIHTRAHAEEDWSAADPWNRPTSYRLNPGEARDYALKFILSPSIREIEPTLTMHGKPVAMGIPGYVLPKDTEGQLFINYSKDIISLDVEPAGMLDIQKQSSTPNGWKRYTVSGMSWGRARLTVTYADGLQQTINYNVIKPEKQVVSDMGRFLTNEQWYENPDDLFGRSPSVMTFDYDKMQIVKEDQRAWIAGLSDEGGAGSWLAAMMKQILQPDTEELEKLRRFFNETLWGGIQYNEGDHKYGVRKSLFYYEPDEMPEGTYSEDINYGTWSAWNRKEAESVVRSYNYPHVAAAHWVFYRLSRDYTGLIPENDWRWYLENACHTAIAMVEQAPYYAQFGQMEGTIFLMILLDLQREGLADLAATLEEVMKSRADLWNSLAYPFGSEMPWDSTGQEEVYAWSKYFGYNEKAEVTLNAILAYMPTLPHWGYNGSARRYWDFVYAGKLMRIERQLHHYGSALNAIPVLSEYRENPNDFYLLRVGYAGMMGALANITKEGFAPAAFHSFPETLKIDGINGDYGPGFLGYAINTGTYVTNHPEFGRLAFGGRIESKGRWVSVTPSTSDRARVYLAELGLWLTLDAGRFQKVEYHTSNNRVRIYLDPKSDHLSQALLHIEQPATISSIGTYKPRTQLEKIRGAYVIPLKKGHTMIELRD